MVLTGLCCLLMGGCEPENPDPAPVPAMTGELVEHYNLILAGQYGPARVRLRQRIDTAPGDGRAHFLMGLAHHHERAYSKAVPWFERALAADPPYPPAAHFLGWAFYHAGDANKSQAAFERHLQLDPNEGDTHFGLGVLALERGDLDDADAFFENAIALQRSNPDRRGGVAKSLARRSEVLEQRGDVAGAVQCWPKPSQWSRICMKRCTAKRGCCEGLDATMKPLRPKPPRMMPRLASSHQMGDRDEAAAAGAGAHGV